MAATAHSYLRIGDRLTLYDQENDGQLGSLGTPGIGSQAGMRSRAHPIHNRIIQAEAVFIIKMQQNHNVENDMRRFREQEGLSPEEAKDNPHYHKLLTQLEREKEANASEFIQMKGREVRYGMIVQVQHERSEKYLTVESKAARCDSEARRVMLDMNAGDLSWVCMPLPTSLGDTCHTLPCPHPLMTRGMPSPAHSPWWPAACPPPHTLPWCGTCQVRIMPALRVHSEGERVHIGDPIVFMHLHTGLWIHVDSRPQVQVKRLTTWPRRRCYHIAISYQ